MRKVRKGISLLLIGVFLLGVAVGFRVQAASYFRYFVLTQLNTAEESNRSSIASYYQNMGYTSIATLFPSENSLLSNMNGSAVSYIHGHGGIGYVNCKNSSGSSYTSLTVSEVLNYSGTFSSNKLIVLMSCHGASASSSQVSMTTALYQKGAKCTIGFTNSVAGAEIWSKYLTLYMQSGETIKSAITSASNNYQSVYPNQSQLASSPTRGVSVKGNTSQYL